MTAKMRLLPPIIALWCLAASVTAHNGGMMKPVDDRQMEVPLHEQPFVQDGEEELARKWGFEVRFLL